MNTRASFVFVFADSCVVFYPGVPFSVSSHFILRLISPLPTVHHQVSLPATATGFTVGTPETMGDPRDRPRWVITRRIARASFEAR